MWRTRMQETGAAESSNMALITGCKLYVDEKSATTAHSLEQARRLAVPCINNRQATKL